MLTPQEVSSHAFTKAVMGGYNMTMVDEFLDEVTDDYTALYKENAALKAKLKVLVEKVEEYRATEDSMRATLLTAQRMADSIVREAETKRDEILDQAKTSAQDQLDAYRRDAAACEERLRQGRQELQQFIIASRELCARELQFLEHLPELAVTEDALETAASAEIQEQVNAVLTAQEPLAAAETAEVPETPPAKEEPVSEIPESSRNQPPELLEEKKLPEAAPEPPSPQPAADEEPTRRINIKELKFGRNYSGGVG